jgi:hypothetical protein
MFPPERIVCLTEETVETLYLLGEQERIVGISTYVVRPSRLSANGADAVVPGIGHIQGSVGAALLLMARHPPQPRAATRRVQAPVRCPASKPSATNGLRPPNRSGLLHPFATHAPGVLTRGPRRPAEVLTPAGCQPRRRR